MEQTYKRKQFFIDPSFQAKFILKFCLIVIVSSVLIGGAIFLFTRGSTTVAIENTKVFVKPTSDFIRPILILVLALVTFLGALAVLILTLFVSHRIAGPVYRLRREIDALREGDLVRNFKIREHDQLQALSDSLNLMASTLRSKQIELKNSVNALTGYLTEKNYNLSAADKEKITNLISEIEKAFGYFKL